MQSGCSPDISLDCGHTAPRCYVCGGSKLRQQFSVPLVDGPFRRHKSETNRTIYRCELCGHLSANLYDPIRYANYYASLSGDYHYCHDYDLSRYEQILRIVAKQSVRKVLDIGCGTGTFLDMFPSDVERFGIEPSSEAADCARAKGIETIDYADLERPDVRNTFDLVTAIDVVEHTADLQEFRRHLATALRPGGTVIILTGDAESRSARFLGRYWIYLNYAEHITCFCPRSVRTWLQPDFSRIELTKTDHHPLNLREGVSLFRIWLLFPVKWLLRKLLPGRLNFYAALSLPGDHMLVSAVRNQPLTQ
jgi:SAM-dependent methyltransferase